MSETNKTYFYEEGHKRETRKSYQLYLNELMEGKVEQESSNCDDSNDDSSIRRSKRTPIPKRSFKLIDNYDEPAKKKAKIEETSKSAKKRGRKLSLDQKQTEELGDNVVPVLELEENSEAKEDSDDVTPRKSSRGHKPKTFNDSIAIPYIKKPVVTKDMKIEQTEEAIFISTSEAVKQRRKSSTKAEEIACPVIPTPVKPTRKKSLSNEPTTKSKRKSDVAESPKSSKRKTPEDIKENKIERKVKKVVETHSKNSPKKKQSKKSVDKSEESRLSKSKTHKVGKVENKSKKVEITADENNVQQDSSQNKEQSLEKTYTYESYVRIGSIKHWPAPNDPLPEAISIPAQPLSTHNMPEQDEKEISSKKPSKKTSKKDKLKGKGPKLLVSFKKKEPRNTIDVKKNKKEETADKNTNETPEITDKLVETIFESSQDEKERKIKKSKKKSKKKKLDNKNQKIIDVKTFPVDDAVVTKVKKKKIYKKRNGQKVLIRIIKNHCNKNGEIVKTETVLVDNIPVEDLDDKKEIKLPDLVPKNADPPVDVYNQTLDQSLLYEEKNDTDFENGLAALVDITTEETFDHEFVHEETKVKKKKTESKKKSEPKNKRVNTKKVPFSRPANKNVTVGGKVVGKTTKGMKKTGVASLEASSPSPSDDSEAIITAVTPTTTTLPPVPIDAEETPHSTEPKNAYNLFCRRYRPMIVQQYPKADFSEISRRLAALWNSASQSEKQEHRARFNDLQQQTRTKLSKLNRTSPSMWSDTEMEFIKKAITVEKENFILPKYSTKRLQPVDFAAHLQLLGDSLSVIAGALEQQSGMTVHGAMSVLLDSMLCSFAPLIFMTSFIPELDCITPEQQARILDNVAYILPGL